MIIEAFETSLAAGLFTIICLLGLGIAIGMYIISQIEDKLWENQVLYYKY